MAGGAPKGNKNAAKGREWYEALRYALASFETDVIARGTALKAIAKKCVEQALDGNRDAITEIGNRLDGKPSQIIDATIREEPQELTFEEIKAQFVKEYGETAAQFLLGEISEKEYLEHQSTGTLNS